MGAARERGTDACNRAVRCGTFADLCWQLLLALYISYNAILHSCVLRRNELSTPDSRRVTIGTGRR